MVFKLRGRLLNMETWTLSPGAPETRRGFFLSASASVGALFHFFVVGEFLLDALPCARTKVPAVVVFAAVQFLGLLRRIDRGFKERPSFLSSPLSEM